MSRSLACAAIGATLALFAFSQDAYASCGPRVSVFSPSLSRTAAIGRWQARVANTQNDLLSDWGYARGKSVFRVPRGLVASGIPCNTLEGASDGQMQTSARFGGRLVRPAGLEPATPRFEVWCSIR